MVQDPEIGKPLFGIKHTETETAIHDRWIMCHRIARYAHRRGLNADPLTVNQCFRLWKLWYSGGLATGYLMHTTGVKYFGQK